MIHHLFSYPVRARSHFAQHFSRTDLRLSLFFGLSEGFWINLQFRYDIEIEKGAATIGSW